MEQVVAMVPSETHSATQSDTQKDAVEAEVSAVPSAANDLAMPPDAAPALSAPTPAKASAAAQQSTGVLTPAVKAGASPLVAPGVDARADTSAIDFIYSADVPVPRAAEVSIKKLFTASHPSADTPIQDKHGPLPCEELEVPRSTPVESVALQCGKACAGYEDCRGFWCVPSLSFLTVTQLT